MERSYIAFISYKHTKRDAAIAKQVHSLIESYVIPKSLRKGSKKLGIVFRDEEELPISSSLTDSISTALDASRYLIVICSPEARKSIWVSREINYFLKSHDIHHIFVVLVDGEPNDVFPYEITHVLNEETGEWQDVEPLALDVRADTLGASLKKTRSLIKKLYAGILGCSYDSLVQREKNRRMKRLAALIALCGLLASSFIGMLFVKNQELSQKNDELVAAIELALNRESELLVGEAEEALLNDDIATALRFASNALYSDEIDRPYYAPAERALFSAVDIMRQNADSPLLSKTELIHPSPIQMTTYSADGRSIYSIDGYGVISSFDASSGNLLWSVMLSNTATIYRDVADPQLWYDEKSGVLVCYYDNILCGLDAVTGKLVWQAEVENDVRWGLFFDQEGQKLAYIEECYFYDLSGASESYYEYNFLVFSTADGRLLNKIALTKIEASGAISSTVSFGRYSDDHSCGMFTDSNQFVGTVFKKENDITETLFSTIDLLKNAVTYTKIENPESYMDYIGTFYIGNDQALILSIKNSTDEQTGFYISDLWLQCLDLKTGALLWENAADSEEDMLANSVCHLIANKKTVLFSIGDNLFAIDKSNGQTLAAVKFETDIISLQPLEDGLFAYTLADGFCAVGWRNQYGFFNSDLFSASINLPDTEEAVAYNGGLIQTILSETSIESFSFLPLADGGGSITYLSDDKCTAYVVSVLSSPDLPDEIPVTAKGAVDETGDFFGADFIDANPQGKVLLKKRNNINVVDTENHSYHAFELSDSLLTSNTLVHLTADGQQIILYSPSGDIHRVDMGGVATTVAKSNSLTLSVVDGLQFVASAFRADSARQTVDGKIITARCDGQQLAYWTDGQMKTTVPLPEGIFRTVSGGKLLNFFFHVGENGLIVAGSFDSADVQKIDHFAVYDLASKKWKQIPDAAHGTKDRLLVFGESSPVFAVYDSDMSIRIYDWNSAALLHCVYTELPDISVKNIGLLLDDQYVYIYTMDNQFIVYHVGTNEIVFRTVFNEILSSVFFAWPDHENARLYLRTYSKGMCIDMKTWQQLFSINNDFSFFSAARNEVYVTRYNALTSTYSLTAIPIPTTSELIGIVRNSLH